MSTAEGAISMKLIPPSEEIFIKEMSQAKQPLSSLDAISSSREKLFSIGLGISNCSSEKQTESHMSPKFQFSSTNSLSLPEQSRVGSKTRKRTRSKSGLKNRKKGKTGKSTSSQEDENIDSDIASIVGSIDTNKNLDSDSSTNTIIMDDLNNHVSGNVKDEESEMCVNLATKRTKAIPGESVLYNVNFQSGNDKHLPVTATAPYSFTIFPQDKDGSSLPVNPKEISTNFYNSNKGRVIISQQPTSLSESLYYPLIKPSTIEGVSQKSLVHSKSNVPLLSNVNNDVNYKFMFKSEENQDWSKKLIDTSSINSVFASTSNPLSKCKSSVPNNHVVDPFFQSYPINLTNQESTKIISGAEAMVKEQLPKSSVSSTSKSVPKACQSDQKLNYQSVYASMGLDEDLCDLDEQTPRQQENNLIMKNPPSSSLSNEFNSVEFPVKMEKDKSPPFTPSCTAKEKWLTFDSKNEILSSNGLHVSMTFEAEPSVEEEEDDLPLSELKNQISPGNGTPKLKEKSEEWNKFVADNINDIHPSLFIKKELIEDEIVSESQAVSSQNVLSVASSSTKVNTSISSACSDFMNVKIKTEPNDDFPGTEPIDNFPVNPPEIATSNTGLIPEIKLKHNPPLELTMTKNAIEPTAPSSFAQPEDKLDVVNSAASPPISKESNFAGNVSDTSDKSKKSKKNGASRKRKLSNKNSKVTSKNMKTSPTVNFEPKKNVAEETLQSLNVCDSKDLHSSQRESDTDLESNSSKIWEEENIPSDFDENASITLLIKRKKTNATNENSPDTFLCTNISKSTAGESKSSSAFPASDNILRNSHIKGIKENTSSDSDIGNLYLKSQNLPTQEKNKEQSKKKQTRKGKKSPHNVSREIMECENQPLNSLNVLRSDEKPCSSSAQLNSTNSETSKVTQNLQSLKDSDSLKTQSAAEQKCQTYVYMTFEEQMSTEENSEDDLNLVSIKKEKDPSPPVEDLKESSDASSDILTVIKNIKKEKEDFLSPETQAPELSSLTPPDWNPESTHLSQVEDTISTISSIASNSNREDDSNVSALSNFENSVDLNLNAQAKKKKRRPRSNGWYKKKKSKSKAKSKPQVLPSVEFKESTDLSALPTNKVPVVIIKNLHPDIKFSNRDTVVKINNVSLEQETAESSAKSKKRKKTTSSKKKKAAKKPPNASKQKGTPKEAGSEGHKDEVLNSFGQSQSGKLLEKANIVKDTSDEIPVLVSDQCSEIPVITSENSSISDEMDPAKKPRSVDCDVQSSPASSGTEKSHASFPSLDVNKISQEIQAYEALLQNRGESSDKSRQSSLSYDNREELNIPTKVSKPNLSENVNLTPESVKSKSSNSFEALSNVCIKKERDADSQASAYCPRENSLLSPKENDRSDSSCNVSQISKENHFLCSNKELSVKDADCNLSNLSQIKKEKEKSSTVQDNSEMGATAASISDKQSLENTSDKTLDFVSKTTTNSTLQSETLKNLAQSPLTTDIDKLALSIKKEVYDDAKSRSSMATIKDQNDLIQKACATQPGKLIIASSNLSDCTTATKSVCSVQKYNVAVEDDEIQILQIANERNSKDVPIVDLTEENNIDNSTTDIQYASLDCKAKSAEILSLQADAAKVGDTSFNASQKCSTKVSPLHSAKQVNAAQDVTIQGNAVQSSPKQFIGKIVYEVNKVIKTENLNVDSNIVSDLSSKEKSYLKENEQVVIDNKKKKALLVEELKENDRKFPRINEDSLESVTKEKENFPVEIETSNSTISKDKYFEEFFKHPFPASMVLHNTKQRNRNKMYTRINSKAWNLSVEEVEARLKLSESIIPQLDKDAAKLEKYPVSVNEVECYHRILGVAPSHKLLFKCFKSPEKKVNTFMSNGFNLFPSFSQTNINNIETEKPINKMTCSLEDILNGITETKMMYSNNVGNDTLVTGKDYPSTESRDSCDSFISNMSGVQNRDLKTVDNLNKVGNEFTHNENSNGRSIGTSCRLPTFSESDLTNVNFMAPQTSVDQFASSFNSNENINIFPSQSALNCLNLPTQDTINNIVNASKASSSCNYFSEVESNIMNTESQSSCHSFNADTGFKSNESLHGEKKVFDIDVPVTELRKILQAAGSLCSDTVNFDDGSLWKSKATYEYNHTQSVPVEKSLECNNLGIGVSPSQITSCSNYLSHPDPLQNVASGRQVAIEATTKSTLNTCANDMKEDPEFEKGSSSKKIGQEDSDSDCVDNEPVCNDDYDRDEENSSHAKEHTSEERPVPQYKSKWEKIMERKSLESKEKEIKNRHLLKDCFPVSSTITRNVVPHKNVSNSYEKLETPSKGTSDKKQNKADKKQDKDEKIDTLVKQKQNDSKSSKPNPAKHDKSSKSYKGKEEKKTKSNSEKETKNKASLEKDKTKSNLEKNKTLISKKNKASHDDSSNLFSPDKPVKISKSLKQDAFHQSNEDNKSKRFYGNRITNRGTFLTESSSSNELLKKIKIPKKKKLEVPKKNFNVRSEEFHSMVKSPDINIEPAFHSYKSFNKSLDSRKNSESYRSPLESASSSSTSHFIRTKHMRNRQMYRSNFPPQERQQYHKIPCDPRSNSSKSLHDEIIVGRKTLLSTPPNISPLINDESSMNRRPGLLNSPSIPFLENDDSTGLRNTSPFSILTSLSSHQSNDGSIMGRSNSHLGPLTSISSHPGNNESLLCKKNPNLTSPSIQTKLPVESFQPSPEINIIQSILSVLKTKKNPSVPEIDEDELPFSDSVNPTWNKYESNSLAYSFKESSRQSMNVQLSGEPATSINKPYGNIHPPDYFAPSKPSSSHLIPAPIKNPFDSVLDTPGVVNSPPFTPSASSSTHIPSQPRKATCLVPQHLKTLVGHKTIETHNVRLLMLEWSVDWLVQQQQFKDPPPISNALKKVVSTYDSFEDYYNTYFPLMLLDTWHRIYVSWTHLNQANPYSCQITSYSVKSQYVSVECQTVFNTAAHPKGVFPDEGSILMVKYTTKSNEYTIKILGYVTHVKTRRFNCVTDSKLFSSLRLYKDSNPDVLQILSLTFMGAYNSEDIDKRQPIKIHVLCNVKPTLKQNDALLFINNSPLQRSILNPVADGLLSFTLTPRNSPLEKTNECVRDITKGILTPHPLPLLTVVRAKPESDRLNIIPMLIEKMKCAYKTKVLLCVRTVRALGDIAANICLHQSLKLVIINKRCDTNPQFQKFLLDELAAAEMSKCSEDKVNEKHHVKNDTLVKMKKHVLKECDVVLSLIRNCHDEFIGETFTETDCVSQMCCIVDEANLCTEPESLIPILHGISKLILIGDSDYPAKVLSKTASSYDYSQSFFQRAYDLDLITE